MKSYTIHSLSNFQKLTKYFIILGLFMVIISYGVGSGWHNQMGISGIFMIFAGIILMFSCWKLKKVLSANIDLLIKIDALGTYSAPFTGKNWITRYNLGKNDISFLIGYFFETLGFAVCLFSLLLFFI